MSCSRGRGTASAAARALVDAGHAATAVSTAYYAMLYAARAALSERDVNARTHAGTWQCFGMSSW
jgi:uncharacterized protein (UPF0332 family)